MSTTTQTTQTLTPQAVVEAVAKLTDRQVLEIFGPCEGSFELLKAVQQVRKLYIDATTWE